MSRARRMEKVQMFKRKLKDFLFHQGMCFECKRESEANAHSQSGSDRMCVLHVSGAEKIGLEED